jgi:hypothetical protein
MMILIAGITGDNGMLKFILASIARRWRDWLPLLPIGALVVLGYSGSGTTWAYVDLLAAAIVSMLVCNPLQLLSVLNGYDGWSGKTGGAPCQG